ncbi:hypothetical protein H5410_050530 [Solanum commersonii]|uniref:DUF4283 domain-containing protein n=1 Tax=Solanum commersonii TaxID=4109 RepID=A0A9J5WX17_SOLCO|nr:hypothetical protein H5410_050530 [Solanum commersonii]
MVLSRGALGWVCKRLTEASEIREKTDKLWRCRDFSTNFFIAEVWYDWVESARHHMRRMVLSRGALDWVCKRLTEASEIREKADKSWRWEKLSKKIEAFINRGTKQTKTLKLSGKVDYAANKGGGGSYRDVLQKSKWTRIEKELAEEGNDTPTRNNVRRWAQQTWNGAHGVQSKKAIEHVLMGDWRRQRGRLKLQWWSSTTGAFPITHEFKWFWIRVLGLPLHLWSKIIMKEIGDRCAGWIETEEETDFKNHLCWARIRVKEAPVTFCKKYDEGACTSKEREKGGYRERNPSDLSRCRNIHRSEKLPVKPNREYKVFLVKAVTGVEKSQKGPLRANRRPLGFKPWTKSFGPV